MNKALLIIVIIIVLITVIMIILYSRRSSSSTLDCTFTDRILTNTSTSKILNIPPRRMWGWGMETNVPSGIVLGYCGETAYQSVMIYYGNYVSQEQVYKAGGNSTFLLGSNDDLVCKKFHMTFKQWPSGPNMGGENVLKFIKSEIDNEHPILMGLYSKETGGDDSFDHTCPVYGYSLGSSGHIDSVYYNDLYQLRPTTLDTTIDQKTGLPVSFQTRAQCTTDGPQPLEQCIPNDVNQKDKQGNPIQIYTCVITGNEDPNKELYPLMLKMDTPDEPDWGHSDSDPDNGPLASPIPLSCTVVIPCLISGEKYSLLRFDNPDDIPRGNFLSSGKFAVRYDFISKGGTYKIDIRDVPNVPMFTSDGSYFFRCVKNTGSTRSNSAVKIDRSMGIPPSMPDRDSHSLKWKNYIEYRIKQKYPKKKLKFTSSLSCKDIVPVVPKIGCHNELGLGTVHANWIWDFSINPNLGCFKVTFNPIKQPKGTTAPACVWFNVTGDNIDDGTTGMFSIDKKLYIDDNSSWQIMAYQIDMKNGSYIMKSQDGFTISTLTPI